MLVPILGCLLNNNTTCVEALSAPHVVYIIIISTEN